MKTNKSALALILTALILAVCVLLPRLFMPDGETRAEATETPAAATNGTALSRADRVALFSTWLPKDDKLKQLEIAEKDSAIEETLAACESIAAQICEKICPDAGNNMYISSSGENLYVTSNGTGKMRIAQIYAEWTGDWKNWLILYFDADTLEVMYGYYSGQCLNNVQNYISDTDIALERTADKLAASMEMTCSGLDYSDSGDWNSIAHFSGTDGFRSYGLYRYVYEDSGPSLLIDLKFSLLD